MAVSAAPAVRSLPMPSSALLQDVFAEGAGRPYGPAHRALRALSSLGAETHFRAGETEWVREDRSGVAIRVDPLPAVGPLATAAEYAGTAAAIGLLSGASRTVTSDDVRERLVEGAVAGAGCEPVRCADGWLVARWRDPREPELLEARLGRPPSMCARGEVWEAAVECRLLVAPVLDQPREITAEPTFVGTGLPRGDDPSHVVDWSNLWAGPWAAGRLAARGHDVTRVEVPGRPDGLLASTAGQAIWNRFNGAKALEHIDVRTPAGLHRMRDLLGTADLLIDGNTPRVRDQLGLGDDWLARYAPQLSVISLRAFDGPQMGAPGLGDMASAVAGLLWRREGARPHVMPWADPLGGAWLLLLAEAWQRAGRPRGCRISLSLESAAGRAARLLPVTGHLAYPARSDTEREKAGIA